MTVVVVGFAVVTTVVGGLVVAAAVVDCVTGIVVAKIDCDDAV